MPDQTQPTSQPDSEIKIDPTLARELLVDELKHRRQRDWRIFVYTTTVLIAVIAAVLAISTRPGFANFGTRQKVVLMALLLVLTAAAGWWLYRSLVTKKRILVQLINGRYEVDRLPQWKWTNLLTGYIAALFLILVITLWAIFGLNGPQPRARLNGSQSAATTGSTAGPDNSSWYFAVSGDSRDCGDLIMPKIAQAIADNKQNAPVEFYWHLGDLRALYRFDCDMAMIKDPSFKCPPERFLQNDESQARKDYLSAAWPDYINSQIRPFENAGVQFYVGIGNHELIPPKTRDQFRDQFKEWLTKPTIQEQRASDRGQGIASNDGDTYFHFIRKGVDIIYLDNANLYDDADPKRPQDPGFSEEELTWFDLVLKRDEADPQIRSIIVGMHAALPESASKDHAMDRNCASFCNGKRAYERLSLTQSRGKKVYIIASHSHYFEEYVYDTPEHNGHGLPGWIIGTAGAEQYRPEIRYGYLLVEVTPDGTIHNSFKRVYSDSSPKGPDALTRFCFEQNKRPPQQKPEAYKTAATCACPTG